MEEVESESLNISTFSNDWFHYFQETTGDFGYSIRYDRALDNLSDEMRKQYPHILEVTVSYLNNTENGLPDEGEFARLNDIEDNLYSDEGLWDMVNYIARITGGNVSRFIFCYHSFEKKADIEMLALLVMGGLILETYSYKAIPYDELAYFDKWIAPNAYEQQHIKNLSIYLQLQEYGEAFKTKRDVDFLFVFNSDIHIEKVKNALIEQEFRKIRYEKMEDGSYHLEVALDIVPELDYMNKWTNWFLQLLENTDGFFDGWGCPVHKN